MSSDRPPHVTFALSGKTIAWDGKQPTLLEFAEAHGLSPDFSCRQGICSTCKCEILSGSVEYISEPLDLPDEGEILICCSRPSSDVTINI